MTLSDIEIADYLKNHPDFFERHPECKPTQTQGSSVVSLTERQLPALRERIRSLENKLADLIDAAHDNEALSDKIQHFAVRLLSHAHPESLRDFITAEIQSVFAVDHVILRFWATPLAENDPPILEEFRAFIADLKEPFCGEHPLYEVNRWFGEAAVEIHSYAVAAVGDPAFGVLVLGGDTAQRFSESSGTLFLSRLTALIAAALQGDRP